MYCRYLNKGNNDDHDGTFYECQLSRFYIIHSWVVVIPYTLRVVQEYLGFVLSITFVTFVE